MISTTPATEDVISSTHDSPWLGGIDLTTALDEEPSKLTTISTSFGLYKYNTLPFAIKQRPALFHSFLERIIQGMSGTEIYQDNIYVYGSTKDEHGKRLKNVLAKLKNNGLKINESKSRCVHHELNIRL